MTTLDLSRVPCSVVISNTSNKAKKVNIIGYSQSIMVQPNSSITVKARRSSDLIGYLSQVREGVSIQFPGYMLKSLPSLAPETYELLSEDNGDYINIYYAALPKEIEEAHFGKLNVTYGEITEDIVFYFKKPEWETTFTYLPLFTTHETSQLFSLSAQSETALAIMLVDGHSTIDPDSPPNIIPVDGVEPQESEITFIFMVFTEEEEEEAEEADVDSITVNAFTPYIDKKTATVTTTNCDLLVQLKYEEDFSTITTGDQFNKGQLVTFKVVPHQGYTEAPTLTINGISEDLSYNPPLQAYISQGDPGIMIMDDFEVVASITE